MMDDSTNWQGHDAQETGGEIPVKYKTCIYAAQGCGECNPFMPAEDSGIGDEADYVVGLLVGNEVNPRTVAYICGAHFPAYELDILKGMQRSMELELAVEEAMAESSGEG